MPASRCFKGRPNGVQLTVIAQALQVIRISSGSLAYSFLAGLAFWIELGTAGLRVPGLRFGDSFRWMTPGGFGAGAPSEPFTLGVNLVAAAILLYFLRGGRSGKKRKCPAHPGRAIPAWPGSQGREDACSQWFTYQGRTSRCPQQTRRRDRARRLVAGNFR